MSGLNESVQVLQSTDIIFAQQIANLESRVIEEAKSDLIKIFGEDGIQELKSLSINRRLKTIYSPKHQDNLYFFCTSLGENIEIKPYDFNNLLHRMTEFDLFLLIDLQMKHGFEIINPRLQSILQNYLQEFILFAQEIDVSNIPYIISLPRKRLLNKNFRQSIPYDQNEQRDYLKLVRSIGNQGLDAEISQMNRFIFSKFGKIMHKIVGLSKTEILNFREGTQPFLIYFNEVFEIYKSFGKKDANWRSIKVRSLINHDLSNARFSTQKQLILEVLLPENTFDEHTISPETKAFIATCNEILNINLEDLRDIIGISHLENPYEVMNSYFRNMIFTLSSLNKFLDYTFENFEFFRTFHFEKVLKAENIVSGQLDGIRIDDDSKVIEILEIKTSPNLSPRAMPSKNALSQITRYIDLVYANYPGFEVKVIYLETSATIIKSEIYSPIDIIRMYNTKKKTDRDLSEF